MKALRSLAPVAALVWIVGAATSCAPEPPARVEVEMTTLAFTPADVTVAVGDTLVWVNHDLVPHTVTSGEAIASGVIVSGETFVFVPSVAGDLAYVCDYHPNMRGTIRVEAR